MIDVTGLDLLHAETIAIEDATARLAHRRLQLQQLEAAAALRVNAAHLRCQAAGHRLNAAALRHQAALARAHADRLATRPFPHLRRV